MEKSIRLGNVRFENQWLKKAKFQKKVQWLDEQFDKALTSWSNAIPDEIQADKRRKLAVILENQRLMVKVFQDEPGWGWMKENSIEVVKQIWMSQNIHLFDMINIHPMLGPCSPVYFRCQKEDCIEEMVARSRKLRVHNPFEFISQDLRRSCDLSLDEQISYMIFEMRKEIQQEIFTDIRNNAGTVMTAPSSMSFEEAILRLSSTMQVKISRHVTSGNWTPTWIVTAPELAEGKYWTEDGTNDYFQKGGKVAGMQVYVNKLFPMNQFLMGYKGDRFEWGYTYAPYVGMCPTTPSLCPDIFCPRPGVITRYAKKLWKKGNDLYGRCVIDSRKSV